MSNEESPAARRHRFAYAIRNLSSVDAAAQLLEAFEREIIVPLDDLPSPLDDLEEGDVPWELAELESLPDWTYETLLEFAITRRPAPSFHFEGEAQPRVMRAHDLLSGRKYELIGILAMACEQAWNLGDKRAVTAMSALCETAVLQVVGLAALRVSLGGDLPEGRG